MVFPSRFEKNESILVFLMNESIIAFLAAFTVSFLGSIPPGTINITVMQLSIHKKYRGAFFFGLAAALVEFIYAGFTVKFQQYLVSQPELHGYLKLFTAIILFILGVINILSKTSSKSIIIPSDQRGRSGFKRGLIIGALNPLTVPFWLVVTAYLETNGFISTQDSNFWFYLIGISSGTFTLLLSVRWLGKSFATVADNQFLVHKVPGLVFIGMALYNLIDWI